MKLYQASLAVVFALCTQFSHGAEQQPLTLSQSIDLPGVKARIDHLSVDLKGNRLFVAALGNNTVEVIDLAAGKRIGSIKGVKEPQGVCFLADDGGLYIGSGGGGSCEIIDSISLKSLASIKLGDDADNVRYAPQSHRVYVGYGSGAIGVIDTLKRKRVADIPLKAHPESFQLESKGNRIFINVPSAMQIAVIDREQNKVVAMWPVHEAHDNYPMALDESHHRLFVGCRKPAKVLMLDTENGKLIASANCSSDTDDLFYDADAGRLYVSCGEGFIDVFAVAESKLTRIQHLPTAARARTSLFVPALKCLYLAVPHQGTQKAEIRVYKTGQH